MRKTFAVLLLLTFFVACSAVEPGEQKINNNPLIESITYAKDSMARMDNEFICKASDVDDDKLEYLWSDSHGNLVGKGQSIIWTSPDNMGNYSITLKVLDNKGGEAHQMIDMRVLTNADGSSAAPVTLLMQFPSDKVVTDNRTVKVGTVTRIDCILEYVDINALTYTWNANGGKMKGKGLEEKICRTVFWTAPPETRLYHVTVDIMDGEGRTAQGCITFDVFCCPRN